MSLPTPPPVSAVDGLAPILPPTEPVQPLSREELFERIAVRPPYFALEELRLAGPGQVQARIPVQQAVRFEALPLSVTEAGRHLAILGSCAAAMLLPAPRRHYFLAHRARLTCPTPQPFVDGPLHGSATATLDRRSAQARTRLWTRDGAPLVLMEVSYRVLAEPVFERLHADHRLECSSEGNPYQAPPAVEIVEASRRGSFGILPRVEPEACAGHFPGFPALPVAIVASSLFQTVEALLRAGESGTRRWWMTEGQLEADALAFAGERLSLRAWRDDESSPVIRAQAVTHRGTVVGEIRTVWQPVEPDRT